MAEKYILMHKDHKVVEMLFDNYEFSGIGEIYNKSHFPICGFFDYHVIDHDILYRWWQERGVSEFRTDLQDIKNNFRDIGSVNEIFIKEHGYSLSDQYWIKPYNSDLKYSDVNFFENDFGSDIGDAMIYNKYAGQFINYRDPSIAVSGYQPKAWIIKNNKRYLFKKSVSREANSEYMSEAISEKIVSDIYDYLEVPHIRYELTDINGVWGSICKCGINADEDLIYASDIMHDMYGPKQWRVGQYRKFLRRNNLEDTVGSMMLIDYIVRNETRCWKDLGIVRNAETGKFTRVFPVFDFGNTLWHSTPDEYIMEKFIYNDFYKKLSREWLAKMNVSYDIINKLRDIPSIIQEGFLRFGVRTSRIDIITSLVEKKVDSVYKFYK